MPDTPANRLKQASKFDLSISSMGVSTIIGMIRLSTARVIKMRLETEIKVADNPTMSSEHQIQRARDNIRNALAFRGYSSFDASTQLNRNRTYLDDFLRDRKQSIANDFINKLAQLLDVSRSYVEGVDVWPEAPNEENVRKFQDGGGLYNSTDDILERFIDYVTSKSAPIDSIEDDIELASKLNALGLRKKELTQRLREFKQVLSFGEFVADRGWWLPYELTGPQIDRTDRFLLYKIEDRSMMTLDGKGFLWGDYVVIDVKNKNIGSGGAFLVREGDNELFRMIEVIRDATPKSIKLRPLNDNFETVELPLSSVEVLGKASIQISRL